MWAFVTCLQNEEVPFWATSAQGVNGYAKNEDEEDFNFAS